MATKRLFTSTHGITSQEIKGEKRKFFKIGDEIPEKYIASASIAAYLKAGILTEVVKGSDGS